jgi:predicted secreted protein
MRISIPVAEDGFLTIWFAALFAAFRCPSQHETGEIAAATDPGAPVAPWLVGKATSTPLISVVVFAALVAFAIMLASIDPLR